ncbi:MAG: hypothetical protein ABIP20_19275 [Chthoniobacteraceae bacterium]
MKLFLDASVVLAACGRPAGASRGVFDFAAANGWRLLTSGYVLAEVRRNLPKLKPGALSDWARLSIQLTCTRDVWTLDRPVVFAAAKDRPVLFTAAAWSRTLLTLDRNDFGPVMASGFYHLAVLTPGDFLEHERAAGRVK